MSADDKGGEPKAPARAKKNRAKKSRVPWVLRIFLISVALSALLSFLSTEALDGAGLVIAFAVLLFFVLTGILFDIVGVAVTAADERPFHSMAARRTPGAWEALSLIKNANQVSSICNDVVGDICGIVSGSTAAVIVLRLQESFGTKTILFSLGVTALVSGITIGGKAVGKTLAIEKSTAVLHLVGRFLHIFSRGKKK